MGTSVTPNLSLINFDTAESIQEDLPTYAGFAAQNGLNCDKLDGLFRNSTHTWTPTWTGSVNPTLGAGGFVEGKYIRLMPALLVGFIRIYAGGAGFAAGTGSYGITMPPAAMKTELDGFNNELVIGKACFYDDSAVATSSAFSVMYSTSGDNLFFRAPAGDIWSATNPVVPAQQDRLSAWFLYPTSAV